VSESELTDSNFAGAPNDTSKFAVAPSVVVPEKCQVFPGENSVVVPPADVVVVLGSVDVAEARGDLGVFGAAPSEEPPPPQELSRTAMAPITATQTHRREIAILYL
jgi:hypothetical protein